MQLRWIWERRTPTAASWEKLLKRAERINLEGIRALADGYLNPNSPQFSNDPERAWNLIGGLEGMNSLYHNAEVLLELAVHAEQWSHPEGPVIAELVRRDSIRLKKLVTRMQMNLVMRRLHVSIAADVQEAAATYVLMRNRVLNLYESSHVARFALVAEAV